MRFYAMWHYIPPHEALQCWWYDIPYYAWEACGRVLWTEALPVGRCDDVAVS